MIIDDGKTHTPPSQRLSERNRPSRLWVEHDKVVPLTVQTIEQRESMPLHAAGGRRGKIKPYP
jgi:hypothetical protein